MSQQALAIIVNLFFPGIGTLMVGRTVSGVIQSTISVLCFVIVVATVGFGLIIFGPIGFINWLWAVITTVMVLDRKRSHLS